MKTPTIRILNQELKLLADIDQYSELYYTRALIEPGDFAFSLPFSKKEAEILDEGNIILIGSDGERAGIIEEIEKKKLEKGSEWIICRGHEAKALLKRRITLPKLGQSRIEMEAPSETIMKELVSNQCGKEAGVKRQFPKMVTTKDYRRGLSYSLSCAFSNLLYELQKCAKASNLGFSITLNPQERELVFDIIEGIDRSASQNKNSRALFADEYDTLGSVNISQGVLGYSSELYVLGAKSQEGRPMAIAWNGEEPEGYDRIENAIDAPSLTDIEALRRYGIIKLDAFPKTFFLEAEIPFNAPIELKKDYELGDLCSVKAYGEWYSVPIYSIEEKWTRDKPGIRLGFGRPAQGAFSITKGAANELMEALRAG